MYDTNHFFLFTLKHMKETQREKKLFQCNKNLIMEIELFGYFPSIINCMRKKKYKVK